jgi:DNA-binding response OmpR family regulator
MTQRIMFVTGSAPDERLIAALEGHGFAVSTETQRPIEIEASLTAPDLIVLDVRDAYEGLELLKEIKTRRDLKTASVLVLAEWGTGQATLALANGADAFEPKPIDATRLSAAVNRFLRPRLVMTAAAKIDGR